MRGPLIFLENIIKVLHILVFKDIGYAQTIYVLIGRRKNIIINH
jgi:hypothetical protein